MMHPKILVMAPDLPYPIKAGSHTRMVSIIEGLGKIGRVHITCRAREVMLETYKWIESLGATIENYARAPVRGLKQW